MSCSIADREELLMQPADRGHSRTRAPRLLGFATQGENSDDECRMRALASFASLQVVPFEKAVKFRSFRRILKSARTERPDVIFMEGTGVAGGAAILLAKWLFRVPFVVSSGDAVGPFLSAKWPAGKPIFHLYEKLLCKHCAGFVGWTPYLVGRALTLGASRAITAAGWAPYNYSSAELLRHRTEIRAQLGIPAGAVVFGIAGSLAWSPRKKYCYGYELVSALSQSRSPLVRVLIVGGGDGTQPIREIAGQDLGTRVILTGRVPREDVPKYLAAMDIGSLPQSVDAIGSFRFTTKISEYFAARLPFVTTQIPASYDLDQGGIYRLPGHAPWDPEFIRSLAQFMDRATPEWVAQARASMPDFVPEFDRERQLTRFTEFITELISQGSR